VQLLGATAAGLPFALPAAAQTLPATHSIDPGPVSETRLGESLGLVSGFGWNVVALTGSSSELLVNGGPPNVSLSITQRVDFLFNTDWHPENTGLNLTVGASGGQILAHEFTRQYLSIDRYLEWQKKTHKPLPAKALPTKTFTKGGSMMFGGQTIEYAPLGQAHTDGDIYVFFRDANVLVLGDMMTVGTYPIADYTSGGWLGGLVTATKTLLDLTNADTRIIPGAGPVQRRADLQAQYDMLSASRDAFVKMMRQGMSADDMLAAGATKVFDARWGNPELFVKTSYRSLWLHVREVGGIV
jgi:glyoxylase-like metal-dependent hydrolase (beta-lactamase superfamily II)